MTNRIKQKKENECCKNIRVIIFICLIVSLIIYIFVLCIIFITESDYKNNDTLYMENNYDGSY